jgi:nanoRNase/pAp phosphatase (c-di-AMP/oligoRNAs hydrolase)
MDIRPISDLRFRNFDIVALIDSQPGAGNNSLPETVSPEIIIDHHFPGYEDSLDAGFIDIRTECGSTSSILAEYLKNSGLESIDRHVATALIYGISSDTRDLGRETGPEDIAAYSFLYPWLNFRLLSKISHPRLPREYFRMFERAIERALIDKDVVISDLEKIHNTDSLSEMADLLIRLEHVNWALCFGEFNGWVHFSLRTGERQGHAGQIAKKIVAGIGAGGGHHVIAGGKVRQNSEMANAYQETTQLLKSRFFAEINRVDFRGKPL